MISTDLKDVLENAVDRAVKSGKEHLNSGHVLLGLLSSDVCLDILRKSGGNVEKLTSDVEQAVISLDIESTAKTTFMEKLLPPVWSADFRTALPFTNEVKKAVIRAYSCALGGGLSIDMTNVFFRGSGRQRDVDVSDLLVGIFKECGPELTNIFQSNKFEELDVLFSVAHGMSISDAQNGITKTEVQFRAKREQSVAEPLYTILVHNDDFTTMEFVVDVVASEFQKSRAESGNITLTVHDKGVGVAGIFPLKTAAQKAIRAMERAQEKGYPFRCSIEPID